jgi:SPP1 family predicted phage head-tail adaptor
METVIHPGELDRWVTIERGTPTTDDLGGEVMSWVPYAETWAKFTPISDSEKYSSAEVGARLEARFLIRWGLNVNPEDRLIMDGRTYAIAGVKEVGRRLGQEITAATRSE